MVKRFACYEYNAPCFLVEMTVADNVAAEAALTEAGFHRITDADVSKL
ncbi:MAG: hypothetical protein IJZ13_09400 [Clostridia bacterium]|nr:hypothetical protein [Clostridia bacterium]